MLYTISPASANWFFFCLACFFSFSLFAKYMNHEMDFFLLVFQAVNLDTTEFWISSLLRCHKEL